MFEAKTLTLAELAERWQRTPRQVMEHAQHLGIPLYFNFSGLAFDEADTWHRFLGDQWEVEKREGLKKSIAASEEMIARARAGKLSQWESLPPGGAPELRAEIIAMTKRLRFIDELLEQRDVERNQCTCAYLRPGPGTLKEIADHGTAPFPRWAFHPEAQITAHTVRDERGNAHLEWSGRLMCLEPRHENDRTWRTHLVAEDLFAAMADVLKVESENARSPVAATPPEEVQQVDLRLYPTQGKSGQAASQSQIPGDIPNTAMGRIAISAAWTLECESDGIRPTAERVMLLLQEWATGMRHAETLREPLPGKRGVRWITGKSEEKSYEIEALSKALARWWKSRTVESPTGQ